MRLLFCCVFGFDRFVVMNLLYVGIVCLCLFGICTFVTLIRCVVFACLLGCLCHLIDLVCVCCLLLICVLMLVYVL